MEYILTFSQATWKNSSRVIPFGKLLNKHSIILVWFIDTIFLNYLLIVKRLTQETWPVTGSIQGIWYIWNPVWGPGIWVITGDTESMFSFKETTCSNLFKSYSDLFSWNSLCITKCIARKECRMCNCFKLLELNPNCKCCRWSISLWQSHYKNVTWSKQNW